jgi:hypothetical protein
MSISDKIADQIADQCETLDQARGVIRALLLSDTRAPSVSLESTHAGLSLRDHFAGMAMQGLISAWGAHGIGQYDEIAHHAYKIAEAMIVVRGKA